MSSGADEAEKSMLAEWSGATKKQTEEESREEQSPIRVNSKR